MVNYSADRAHLSRNESDRQLYAALPDTGVTSNASFKNTSNALAMLRAMYHVSTKNTAGKKAIHNCPEAFGSLTLGG